MNPAIPDTRQWTIRLYPWFSITGLLITAGILVWGLVIEQLSPAPVLMIGFLLAVAMLVMGELIICTIDLDQRNIHLRIVHLWLSRQVNIPFSALAAVSVQELRRDQKSNPVYRVVFVLKSGESIPMVSLPTAGKRGKQQMAQRIIAYINQVQFPPVPAAQEGITPGRT